MGYKVEEAESAAEATAVFNTGVAIDLVFSDIKMPGEMDGHDLAFRERHPTVEIILTSGHFPAVERNATPGGETVVPKPYDANRILERIRQLLTNPRSE